MNGSRINPNTVDLSKTRRRIEDKLRKETTPEDLVRVAELLGVEVAILSDEQRLCPCMSANRPHFRDGMQVTCMYQLVRGRRYFASRAFSSDFYFTVVSEPFQTDRGWAIWTTGTIKGILFLADFSVVLYPDGHWNEHDWIGFVSD